MDAEPQVPAHDSARQIPGVRVSPIRVVLAALPPLLGDIVRETLVRDAEALVDAEVGSANDITPTLERATADVVVVGVAPSEWSDLSSLVRLLLFEHPRLTIVALASDGRSGYVYQQQPRGVAIHDITPKSLVHAIRSTATTDLHPGIHPFSAE